jgi:uncharacterized membrane protein
MAEATKPVRRRRQRAESKADEGKKQIEKQTPKDESSDQGGEQESGSGAQQDGGSTVTSELKSAIREAAIEVLRPVATQATKSAAKFAVTKGPDLVKDKVGGAGGAATLAKGALSKGTDAAGGVGNVVGGIADKVTGKGDKGGKKPTGHGRGRRLPVQEHVDVAADLETVYDQFTQFEDWPEFMHRVEKVEQKEDTTVMFHENIWGVRRSWEAEIVEQIPCERIVWRGKGQVQVVGVATFHRLSDNLTRVQVNMDFQPKGLFEKTASGMRLSRRALKSDLMRFRAFVEMRDEATGDWKGVIEEGEVSESPEEHEEQRDEERDGEEPEASAEEEEEPAEEEEEPEEEDVEDDEPEAASEDDEEYEDDYEEEEEPEASAEEDEEEAENEDDEEKPRSPSRRRRSRAGATATAARSRRR